MTPEQLACAFWEMASDEQAQFFATLEVIAGHKLCIQMACVVSEIAETNNTDAMNGFRTMLAHSQAYHEDALDIRVSKAKREIARMGVAA